MNLAIEITNLNISFNKVKILQDVNFALKKGEIHALAGKNGAGKSTLMKAITGINKIHSHCIKVFNEEFISYGTKEAINSKIAMVYQDLSLIKTMSITQNIFLTNNPYSKFGILNDKKAKIKALELLKMLGIQNLDVDTIVSDISVGECQLVEIAKALSSNPKILILDEPTASLTTSDVNVLFESIKKLKQNGISIVYITHYLEDIMNLCDKVSVLRDGKIISTLNTKETSIKKIVSDMLGDDTLSSKNWQDKTISNNSNKIPILELKNIQSKFISSSNLKIYKGEIVGLAGLLGSGRTQILNLIYGLNKINKGSILINGKITKINNISDAKNNNISLSPPERRTQGLVMDFSIKHNLVMPILEKISSFLFLNKNQEEKIANDYIARLQIKSQNSNQITKYLSGGNQQKIVIGKCLVSDAKILLLNDPTFGIDIHSKIQIMTIIKDFAKKGGCVLFVSSEFKEIADFCNRTYIVKKRKIIKEIPNTNLNEEKLLQEVQ
jgi:ribose transport system ATP-binding protein